MQDLVDKIREEGKALGSGILKVDGFINHRVDAVLMYKCGIAFAEFFKSKRPDLVLTAEISGIAPALMTASALQCKVVYARKKRPVTMPENAGWKNSAGCDDGRSSAGALAGVGGFRGRVGRLVAAKGLGYSPPK